MTKSVVNVHEAKTHLSRLLERVEAGEEIDLARRGKVIAQVLGATLVTSDATLRRYEVDVLVVA